MEDLLTDAQLVARAKAGELQAFEELVKRHEQRAYTLSLRIVRHEQDAEDVTQQAFINALQHLAEFREESGFGTWLMRIATFAALKVIRKRRGLATVSLDEATTSDGDTEMLPHPEYIADWSQSPSDLAHNAEVRRILDTALEELDDKHRLVFVLRDIEGFSVRETAAALELSEANVKVRLLRARLQLRERLTKVFGDPKRALEPHGH